MADSDNEPASRIDKKKKKKRETYEVSVINNVDDRMPPVVGYFPSGYNPCDESREPPDVRVFRNKRHRSRMDVVVKPGDSNVEFVGKSYEGEAALPHMCEYTLGVLDKDAKTLTIVPIAANKIFRLEPRVIKSSSVEKSPQVLEEDTAAEKTGRTISDLTSLYGTRKQKKLDKKFSQLKQQTIDPSAQRDLLDEMLDADMRKEALTDGKETAGPNIPPHDLSAVTPEKAYLLDQMILKGERDYLFDILELLQSGVDEKPMFWEENYYPSFVINRIPKLKQIQDEDEKNKHAFILSYITHLVNFWKIAVSSRRSKSLDKIFGDATNQFKIPRIVCQKLAELFLDPASNVLSTEKKELLIGYVLVLTLFADGFCSNPSDIAKDLGMTIPELRLYFMQLGCKLSTDSRSGVARTKYLWTLPVPLKFADLTKKKRPKK